MRPRSTRSQQEPSSPMASNSHGKLECFSLPLFIFTVITTLAGLYAIVWLTWPTFWAEQLHSNLWKGVVAFLAISFVNCFIEYFFHRYFLHTPVIPFLRKMYRQHTLHHALTHIIRKPGRGGNEILFIENKYPIMEPEQGEASFFPWYSLAAFAAVLTPLFVLLQWLLPEFPWFIAGYAALAVSLCLYELLHAIDHWPFETWAPLIQHPRWGHFWQAVYGFHLRHHAVTDCNESISGFFGLPLGDWVFRTCVIPKTVYAEGEVWTPDKFQSPRPRWLIRQLDAWTHALVKRRRAAAAVTKVAVVSSSILTTRPETRGEKALNWVTHGLGLSVSISALTLLIVFASLRGDAWHVVSFTIFGLALLLLHSVSTIYNAFRAGRAKAVFHRLDYAAIFILIAGTYTPLLLTNLRGPWGWSLFGIVWGLCGAGAVFNLFVGERFRIASLVASIFVGWLAVVALKPLLASVPSGGLWLLLAGGLCYTLGVPFFAWKRLRYHYALWHTCALGGGVCHLLAALLFLLPRGAA